jgi:hypothetical protein
MTKVARQPEENLELQLDFLLSFRNLRLALRLAVYIDHRTDGRLELAERLVDGDWSQNRETLRRGLKIAQSQPHEMQRLVEFFDKLIKNPTEKLPTFHPSSRRQRRRK